MAEWLPPLSARMLPQSLTYFITKHHCLSPRPNLFSIRPSEGALKSAGQMSSSVMFPLSFLSKSPVAISACQIGALASDLFLTSSLRSAPLHLDQLAYLVSRYSWVLCTRESPLPPDTPTPSNLPQMALSLLDQFLEGHLLREAS